MSVERVAEIAKEINALCELQANIVIGGAERELTSAEIDQYFERRQKIQALCVELQLIAKNLAITS